jgi:hypothetical protein
MKGELDRSHQTYLETKVQTQRDRKTKRHNQRPKRRIKVLATSLPDKLRTVHIHPVPPRQRKRRNTRIHHGKRASNVIPLASCIVQPKTERGKQDATCCHLIKVR